MVGFFALGSIATVLIALAVVAAIRSKSEAICVEPKWPIVAGLGLGAATMMGIAVLAARKAPEA